LFAQPYITIDSEVENKYFSDGEEDETERGVAEWIKEWSKKEAVLEKVKRISK